MARIARIITSLIHSQDSDTSPILAPAMKGLPVGVASVLCALPIHDANARLLAEVAGAPRQYKQLRAGVFAVDQFRTLSSILIELGSVGIDHVLNWPSVALMGPDIEARHAPVGIGYEREVEFARNSTAAGWTVTGVVMDEDQAARMLDAGCKHLLFHPPLDLVGGGFADQAALGIFEGVRSLARSRGSDVSFYAEVEDEASLPLDLPFQLDVFSSMS